MSAEKIGDIKEQLKASQIHSLHSSLRHTAQMKGAE